MQEPQAGNDFQDTPSHQYFGHKLQADTLLELEASTRMPAAPHAVHPKGHPNSRCLPNVLNANCKVLIMMKGHPSFSSN